jgi:AraC-like DNA-binding protein
VLTTVRPRGAPAVVFRQEIGLPPGEFILRSKIDHARHLLGGTDLSVTDIAHALGFSSAQYFATAFKRLTRTTPSLFRQSVRLEPDRI